MVVQDLQEKVIEEELPRKEHVQEDDDDEGLEEVKENDVQMPEEEENEVVHEVFVEPKYKSRIEATIRYHMPPEMEDLEYPAVSINI